MAELSSEPNSEGTKRLTEAAMQASIMRIWVSMPEGDITSPMVEITASKPVKAVVREEREE